MRIDTHRHYFAVMKAKLGELQAVQEIAPDVRAATSFVWEISALPYNHETSTFAKTIESHLSAFAKRLHDLCPWEQHCFVDCRQLSSDGLNGAETPLEVALSLTSDLGGHPSICDQPTDRVVEVVRRHLRRRGGEVLLRLSPRTFATIGFRQKLQELLTRVGAEPGQCHLFLDFGQLLDPKTEAPSLAAYSAINGLVSPLEWLSVSVVGGSMPKLLPPASECPKVIPRLEWAIWRDVVANLGMDQRLPSFGDYGVSSYEVTELDPRLITVSANIRYTGTDGYWIFKGKNLRRFSFDQFRSLSQQVVSHPAYSGAPFSWGDNFILQCAEGKGGTGNSTTWRRVGTNHHVSLVSRQVAERATSANPDDA